MSVIYQIEKILEILQKKQFINKDEMAYEINTIKRFYQKYMNQQYNFDLFQQVYSKVSNNIQDLVEIQENKSTNQEYFYSFQIPKMNNYNQNQKIYVYLKSISRSSLDQQNQFKLTNNQIEAHKRLEQFLEKCYQIDMIDLQEFKKYKDQLQKQLKIYTKEYYLNNQDDHDIPYYFLKFQTFIPELFNCRIQALEFQFTNQKKVSIQFPSQKNSLQQYYYQNNKQSIDQNEIIGTRNQQKNRDHHSNLNYSPLYTPQNPKQNENNKILCQQDQNKTPILNNSNNNARSLITKNNQINPNPNSEQYQNGKYKNTTNLDNQFKKKSNIVQNIPLQNQQNNDFTNNHKSNEIGLISDNSYYNKLNLEKNNHVQIKQTNDFIIKTINNSQNNLMSNQLDENKINAVKNNQLFLKNGKIKGFQNIYGSCYVNTSLQVLQQINYLCSSIFNKNKFGEKLQKLFNSNNALEEKQILQYIINQQNKFQDHSTFGGDSFLCLLTLIDEIKNNYDQKNNNFTNYFEHKLEKGSFCKYCCCFIQELEQTFCSEYEIGFEINRIEQVFTPVLDSISEKCPKCQNFLIMLQIIKQVPIFLFVKVEYKQNQQKNDYIFDLLFHYGHESKDYKIIGVCNYFGNHYSYTAKYDDKWYELNDSKIEQTQPSSSNALFYVLQHQQQY